MLSLFVLSWFKEILNFLKLYNLYSATAYTLVDFTNVSIFFFQYKYRQSWNPINKIQPLVKYWK